MKGVIAYTDFLVANGYAETTGDAANRERYGRVAVPAAKAHDEGVEHGAE